jgi:anti-sigma B factor antagonist
MARTGQTDVVKQIKKMDSVVLIELQGDVDLHHSPQLRQTLSDVISQKPSKLVINLGDVRYMDSSGVATLVEALQRVRKANLKMALAEMSDRVKSVFEIARLDTIFNIHPTTEEAVSA